MSNDHASAMSSTDPLSGSTDVPGGWLVPSVGDQAEAGPAVTHVGLPADDRSTAGATHSLVSATPGEAIEFRVTCPGAPTRRLRLCGHRYTLGSGDGCSIRLSDESLLPMHAVLLHEGQRVLVRAYSVPVDVNGNRLAEATLDIGDRLRLGCYQFELLSKQATSPVAGAGFVLPPITGSLRDGDLGRLSFADTAAGVSDPLAATGSASGLGDPGASAVTASGNAEDDIANAAWKARFRREAEMWRARQAECDRRDARCDGREAELQQRESELWARSEELRQRESQLGDRREEVGALQKELSEVQQELRRVRSEASQQDETFRQREAEWERLREEYQTRADETTDQLERSQRRTEEATQAVERIREQLAALIDQLQQLSAQQSRLEKREQDRVDEQRRLHEDLERARDEAIARCDEAMSRRDEAIRQRDEAVDDKADSEAARQAAEELFADAAAELQRAREQRESDRLQIAESDELVESLRREVEELRAAVGQAREQSERLRGDCERADADLRELRSRAEQDAAELEAERSRWAEETEQLRDSVTQLSAELEAANAEIQRLRGTNQTLTERLEAASDNRSGTDKIGSERSVPERSVPENCDAESGEHDWGGADPGELAVNESAAEVPTDDGLSSRAWPGSSVTEADPETDDPEPAWQTVSNKPLAEPRSTAPVSAESVMASWSRPEPSIEDDASPPESLEKEPPIFEDPFRAFTPNANGDSTASGYGLAERDQDLAERPENGRLTGFESSADDEAEAADRFVEKPPVIPPSDDEADDFTAAWSPEGPNRGGAADDIASPRGLSSLLRTEPRDAGEGATGAASGDPRSGERVDQASGDIEVSADIGVSRQSPLEDDSIEAYMNRLLRRVHGDAADDGPPPSPLTEETDTAIAEPAVGEEPHDPPEDSEYREVAEPLDSVDPETTFIPRSEAPEKNRNLSAMRALANESARNAITRSVRIQTRDIQIRASIKFGQAAITLATGAAALWWIDGSFRYVGAAAAFIVTAFFVSEGLTLFKEARRRLALAEAGKMDEPGVQAELSADDPGAAHDDEPIG